MKLCAKWSQNSDVSIKNPFPQNRVEGADKIKLYYGVPLKRLWHKAPEIIFDTISVGLKTRIFPFTGCSHIPLFYSVGILCSRYFLVSVQFVIGDNINFGSI